MIALDAVASLAVLSPCATHGSAKRKTRNHMHRHRQREESFSRVLQLSLSLKINLDRLTIEHGFERVLVCMHAMRMQARAIVWQAWTGTNRLQRRHLMCLRMLPRSRRGGKAWCRTQMAHKVLRSRTGGQDTCADAHGKKKPGRSCHDEPALRRITREYIHTTGTQFKCGVSYLDLAGGVPPQQSSTSFLFCTRRVAAASLCTG